MPFTLTPRAVKQLLMLLTSSLTVPTVSMCMDSSRKQSKVWTNLISLSISSGIWASGKQQVSLDSRQDWQMGASIPLGRASSCYCLLLSFGVDLHFRLGCSVPALEPSSLTVCQGNEVAGLSFSFHSFSRVKSVNLQVWVWLFLQFICIPVHIQALHPCI